MSLTDMFAAIVTHAGLASLSLGTLRVWMLNSIIGKGIRFILFTVRRISHTAPPPCIPHRPSRTQEFPRHSPDRRICQAARWPLVSRHRCRLIRHPASRHISRRAGQCDYDPTSYGSKTSRRPNAPNPSVQPTPRKRQGWRWCLVCS